MSAHAAARLPLEMSAARLADVIVAIDYDIFKNTAMGVGYNFVTLDLEADKARFRGTSVT